MASDQSGNVDSIAAKPTEIKNTIETINPICRNRNAAANRESIDG